MIVRESEAYKIITNPDLLAVNQDPLGVQVTNYITSAKISLPPNICQKYVIFNHFCFMIARLYEELLQPQ